MCRRIIGANVQVIVSTCGVRAGVASDQIN